MLDSPQLSQSQAELLPQFDPQKYEDLPGGSKYLVAGVVSHNLGGHLKRKQTLNYQNWSTTFF